MQHDDHGLLGRDLVLAAGDQDGPFVDIRTGLNVEPWCCRTQSHAFPHDPGAIRQLVEVVVCELAIPQHGIYLLPGFRDTRGISGKVVQSGGDHAGGGGAANRHGDNLVDNLTFLQPLARDGILAVDHHIQHIPASLLSQFRVLPSILEALPRIRPHGLAIPLELVLMEQPVDDARAGGPHDGLARRSIHGRDHGIRFLARDAAEFPAIEAQRGRFEIQAIQVIDRHHRSSGSSSSSGRPFPRQFAGALAQLGESHLDGIGRQERGQDAVVDGPGRFVGEGGEEGIVHGAADLDDGPANEFAEAGLVAQLGAEGDGADEDDLLAQDGDFED